MSDENRTTTSQPKPYEQWVAGIKKQDSEAWKYLIKVHGRDLRDEIQKSLRKRGLPLEFIDDIEQDTWVSALHSIVNFEWQGEDQFYHWLRVISLNHIRKLKRDQDRQVSIDDFEDQHNETELEQFYAKYGLYKVGIEDHIILRERMIMIDYALRQLKPHQSEIFIRWLMGEKPRELAIVYGKRPETISMFLMRTKQTIKDQLEGDDRND